MQAGTEPRGGDRPATPHAVAPGTSRALDALNFFLADVRDGLGPYLAIWLLTVAHWNEGQIGLVMTIAGLIGIAVQTPAGVLVDAVRAKRGLLIAAALVITAACWLLPLAPAFGPVALGQAAAAAAGAVILPALSAITLGIVGPVGFARRTGRNESWNHAGNAVAALLAGTGAYFFGPIAVFWLMGLMAIGSVIAALTIPTAAIDPERARGLAGTQEPGAHTPSGIATVLENRGLLVFAACLALFHFANAAMLPLVGQQLALADRAQGTALMSACIVAAQLVMIPVAALTGLRAGAWGRKPFLIAGFVILAARGALYTLSDDRYWLVGVQLLDGFGAGIVGVLLPLVVADLTRGSGRFNAALGAVLTVQGIGAALSAGFAGQIIVRFGYDAAYLALAGAAGLGLLLAVFAMPETATGRPVRSPLSPPGPQPLPH